MTDEVLTERTCPLCPDHKRTPLVWGDHVCPHCLGRIRGDMRAAEDCCAMLAEEAQHKGVTSEAAHLAGPHVDPTLWTWHRINARRAGEDVEDWDKRHPGVCFGHWERELREDFEHDDVVLTSPTLAQSRAYLDTIVSVMARSEAHVLVLAEMADDMRALRRHLEGVLRDGEQVERGVECPACPIEDKPRLVHQMQDYDTTGASDRWQCPRKTEHWWSEADYRQKIGEDYLMHAEKLTASDMLRQYRVPEGTLRRWANGTNPTVRKRGRDDSGRQLYDVADVKVMREVDGATLVGQVS